MVDGRARWPAVGAGCCAAWSAPVELPALGTAMPVQAYADFSASAAPGIFVLESATPTDLLVATFRKGAAEQAKPLGCRRRGKPVSLDLIPELHEADAVSAAAPGQLFMVVCRRRWLPLSGWAGTISTPRGRPLSGGAEAWSCRAFRRCWGCGRTSGDRRFRGADRAERDLEGDTDTRICRAAGRQRAFATASPTGLDTPEPAPTGLGPRAALCRS